MSQVAELTSDLVRFRSISDVSNVDVSAFIHAQLSAIGFSVETLAYRDPAGVSKMNLVAKRGDGNGGLAYFAHSDVVPANDWRGPGTSDPFDPVVESNRLYGRGSCDMKGSLAAMLTAARAVSVSQQHAPLWIVVTADEETGFGGAKEVVARSKFYQTMVQQQPVALIGEPTMLDVVHAHKGIHGFRVTSHGKAAHSSTRDGINATLPMISMLAELKKIYDQTELDPALQDERFDPPTLSWNIGISQGGRAVNVTPALCQAWVSLRTMPSIDGMDLVEQAQCKARCLGLAFERLDGCGPLWVDPQSRFVQEMVRLSGASKSKTVCYGTDGGIFNDLRQMVVCGPGDIAQAHTADEWIDLWQLDRGVEIYKSVIEHWCCQHRQAASPFG